MQKMPAAKLSGHFMYAPHSLSVARIIHSITRSATSKSRKRVIGLMCDAHVQNDLELSDAEADHSFAQLGGHILQ
jgi:hypothetical protein